ncbi:MAG: methylenetetrahydrofolate reductase [Pseudomonadota bacterium]
MAPTLSFEFFPPKDLPASFRLWDAAQSLLPLSPEYVSVTYGAGGSTRDLTHETVTALSQQGARVAAHLTCVGATKDETLGVARRYREAGVHDIVALRGDAPKDQSFEPHPDGFASSLDLTAALAKEGFRVQVGAYPEPHPDSRGAAADLDWMRAKMQAGAQRAVTQFFFEPETFLRYRDAWADAGIPGDLVPGILPIHDWTKARSFAKSCGASIPADLNEAFERAIREDRHDLMALAHTVELCDALTSEGVDHLHIYTLNRPDLTREVARALGCPATEPLRKVA